MIESILLVVYAAIGLHMSTEAGGCRRFMVRCRNSMINLDANCFVIVSCKVVDDSV